MIDWVSLTAPWSGPEINGGCYVHFYPDMKPHYSVDKYMQVEGSFSSKVSLRAYGDEIYISGNFVKYLQGHNLWGTNDLLLLVETFAKKLIEDFQIPENHDFREHYPLAFACLLKTLAVGDYRLHRVDLTESFSFGSRTDAKQWLKSSFIYLQKNRQEISNHGLTWYIGKKSKRLTAKAYFKGDEIKNNSFNFNGNSDLMNALKSWANDKNRIEFTLRSNELVEKVFCHKFVKKSRINFTCQKKTLNNASIWTPQLADEIYSYLLKEKVKLPKDTGMSQLRNVERLPKKVRPIFFMWENGFDLTEQVPRATLYRYRNVIKDCIGVDIMRDAPNANDFSKHVIPLIRYIEAKPASIPDWAYDYNLVACNQ